MRVLIVGDDGRKHAVAWKISQSPKVEKLYCIPDNAGITKMAKRVDIGVVDLEKLVAFIGEQAVDPMVVRPGNPLAAGTVDILENAGIRVLGPRKDAAILEVSKAFSRDSMKRYNIPSTAYEAFDPPEEAPACLKTAPIPIVLRADDLALGKGVPICNTREETKGGVRILIPDRQFGSTDDRVMIEESIAGREVSMFSFVDGHIVEAMISTQDHKRAKDRNQGLNTGRVETFSLGLFYTDEADAFCRKYAHQPTMDAMKAEGRGFREVIFSGLMLTESGPKMLEYNARFGNPETQVVLSRVKNDIVGVFGACVDGALGQAELEFEGNVAVCVVLASDGYPEHHEEGYRIDGLDRFDDQDGYCVLYTGSKFNKDRDIVASGGRAPGVMAKGNILKEARKDTYRATEWVEFEDKYMGHDIGEVIDEA